MRAENLQRILLGGTILWACAKPHNAGYALVVVGTGSEQIPVLVKADETGTVADQPPGWWSSLARTLNLESRDMANLKDLLDEAVMGASHGNS